MKTLLNWIQDDLDTNSLSISKNELKMIYRIKECINLKTLKMNKSRKNYIEYLLEYNKPYCTNKQNESVSQFIKSIQC